MKSSNSYGFLLFLRLFLLLLALLAFSYSLFFSKPSLTIGAAILSIILWYALYKTIRKREKNIDDFFEAVKYRDFSRWYVEDKGPTATRKLHKGFNQVNQVIKTINAEKETQHLYLQKILEMLEVGIIAYNLQNGKVLWVNEFLKRTLDIPSLKNIDFLAKRKPELHKIIFETPHNGSNSVSLNVHNGSIQVLLTNTIFQVKDDRFKLIVLQNIDAPLNRNEAEAWKKLLSVMTHEIMNSIAPISSLADTLQNQVSTAITHRQPLPDLHDLNDGLISISKRSEGLIKFAKTYRSLNKVPQLNLEQVEVKTLFQTLRHLMKTTLLNKNITLETKVEDPNIHIKVDTYLIEQVLINLLLNAVEACAFKIEAKINISAKINSEGRVVIQILDNGKGVPPEIIDRIFVPFFTTKKAGSGVGLSLCKKIMLLHDGKIQINSEVDKGTLISLIF